MDHTTKVAEAAKKYRLAKEAAEQKAKLAAEAAVKEQQEALDNLYKQTYNKVYDETIAPAKTTYMQEISTRSYKKPSPYLEAATRFADVCARHGVRVAEAAAAMDNRDPSTFSNENWEQLDLVVRALAAPPTRVIDLETY